MGVLNLRWGEQVKINTLRLSLLATLTMLLAGCTIQVMAPEAPSPAATQSSTNEEVVVEESGPSALAIEQYRVDASTLYDTEIALIERYDSVSGANYTDDATMYAELIELVPDIQRFILELESITPSDPELAAMHAKWVKGWNDQAKGMTLTIQAIVDQDYELAAEANDALAQGRANINDFINEAQQIFGE